MQMHRYIYLTRKGIRQCTLRLATQCQATTENVLLK